MEIGPCSNFTITSHSVVSRFYFSKQTNWQRPWKKDRLSVRPLAQWSWLWPKCMCIPEADLVLGWPYLSTIEKTTVACRPPPTAPRRLLFKKGVQFVLGYFDPVGHGCRRKYLTDGDPYYCKNLGTRAESLVVIRVKSVLTRSSEFITSSCPDSHDTIVEVWKNMKNALAPLKFLFIVWSLKFPLRGDDKRIVGWKIVGLSLVFRTCISCRTPSSTLNNYS